MLCPLNARTYKYKSSYKSYTQISPSAVAALLQTQIFDLYRICMSLGGSICKKKYAFKKTVF